jgi:hypothetical protein
MAVALVFLTVTLISFMMGVPLESTYPIMISDGNIKLSGLGPNATYHFVNESHISVPSTHPEHPRHWMARSRTFVVVSSFQKRVYTPLTNVLLNW